jgi:hypothetical protein
MSSRSVNRFNQSEVARALRAARLAGESVDRVEIDPKRGKISMILKSGAPEPTARMINPWDEVLNDDESHEKRPS